MLGFLIALYYFYRLHQFQDPSGADGYFYLKQIQSLSNHAQFYYKDYSFGFYPAAVLNIFLHDPLLSYQIVSSLCFGFIFFYVRKIVAIPFPEPMFNFYNICSALLTAAILYQNSAWMELNYVFMKTAFATLFLLVGCERFLKNRNKTAITFLIFAVLSHKIMLLIVPIGLVILFVGKKDFSFIRFKNSILTSDRKIKTLIIGIFLALAIVMSARFFQHMVHLLDRVDFSKFSLESINLFPFYSLTILSYVLTAVVLVIFLKKQQNQPGQKFLTLFSAFLLLLPSIFPDSINTNSVSFRLVLIGAPFMLIGLSILIHSKGLTRSFGLILAALIVYLNQYYARPLSTWVVPWSTRIQNAAAIEKIIPANSLLYAPHGLEFYLAYVTRFRPRSFLVDSKGREVFRVAYVKPYLGHESLLKNDLSQMAVTQLGPEFYIFRERDWLLINDIHLLRPHVMNLLERIPDFIADYD